MALIYCVDWRDHDVPGLVVNKAMNVSVFVKINYFLTERVNIKINDNSVIISSNINETFKYRVDINQ